MSTMNNLPDRWDVKPLGEACKTIKGKKPKNSGPATTERTVPYINIKAFESGQPVEFAAPGNYPTCERDDVLIVWDGARAGLSGRAVPGYIGSTLAKVYSDVADNRYLFYFLQSQYGRINSRTKGVGIPHVDPTIFNNIPFPIAPPEQQKHIVAEIEKQFSRLDEAVANPRRVKANLKRYKAAILKAAVEGRLVETEAELARRAAQGSANVAGGRMPGATEGRNYETGAQLLQRILETRRSQWKGKGKYKEPAAPNTTDLPEMPEGWVWANWEQIGFSQNGRPFPSSDYCDQGVRLLRPGNLHESGALVWTAENTRHLPPQYAGQNPDLIVQGRELVMNLTAQSLKDEFLGRVCFTADGEHCLLNQRLARLIPIEVVPEFVLVVFKSKWFRRFVDGLNTGSLIQHMFTSQLAKFAFPIPPIAEQYRIVGEVDRRLSLVREVEVQVDVNLKRADRLRASTLGQAFCGSAFNAGV